MGEVGKVQMRGQPPSAVRRTQLDYLLGGRESNCCTTWHSNRVLIVQPLPVRFFQQPLLELLLALDAVARPGHSLKPLGIDFFAAMNALSKAAFSNAGQSSFDHLQKLTLIIALAEQKFFRVGAGGPIGYILGCVFICGTAIGLGAGDCAAQILLPRLKPLLECL
jgi:hypothetical protein